jgi:hypothetical protein
VASVLFADVDERNDKFTYILRLVKSMYVCEELGSTWKLESYNGAVPA